MPILGWCSRVHMGAGRWSVEIREKIHGEDCCWLWGDSLRGWEGRNPKQGMYMEQNQTAKEAECHCLVTQLVEPPLQPLFPHKPVPTTDQQKKPSQDMPLHTCHQVLEKAQPVLALFLPAPGPQKRLPIAVSLGIMSASFTVHLALLGFPTV